MPSDMAVEEPCARVVGLESYNKPSETGEHSCVAAGRVASLEGRRVG
jgi:hypothetical protein